MRSARAGLIVDKMDMRFPNKSVFPGLQFDAVNPLRTRTLAQAGCGPLTPVYRQRNPTSSRNQSFRCLPVSIGNTSKQGNKKKAIYRGFLVALPVARYSGAQFMLFINSNTLRRTRCFMDFDTSRAYLRLFNCITDAIGKN